MAPIRPPSRWRALVRRFPSLDRTSRRQQPVIMKRTPVNPDGQVTAEAVAVPQSEREADTLGTVGRREGRSEEPRNMRGSIGDPHISRRLKGPGLVTEWSQAADDGGGPGRRQRTRNRRFEIKSGHRRMGPDAAGTCRYGCCPQGSRFESGMKPI